MNEGRIVSPGSPLAIFLTMFFRFMEDNHDESQA
jgi:hypothetical protein